MNEIERAKMLKVYAANKKADEELKKEHDNYYKSIGMTKAEHDKRMNELESREIEEFINLNKRYLRSKGYNY